MKFIAICAAVVLLLQTPITYAGNDLKKEIISRCKSDMGEYGAALVKSCVDQDIRAVNTLAKYSKKHNDIVARCMSQMREYGFVMVKACADQDIEAESALSRY